MIYMAKQFTPELWKPELEYKINETGCFSDRILICNEIADGMKMGLSDIA